MRLARLVVGRVRLGAHRVKRLFVVTFRIGVVLRRNLLCRDFEFRVRYRISRLWRLRLQAFLRPFGPSVVDGLLAGRGEG